MASGQILKEAAAARALKDSLASLEPDDELLAGCIEGETSLMEAIDALLGRMEQSRAMIAGINIILAEIEARKRRYEVRLEMDRGLLEQAMLVAELDKLERPLATLSLSDRAPRVEVHTPADVPSQFWRASDPVLDKRALAKALTAGQSVPGACLSNAAPSLTVRIK